MNNRKYSNYDKIYSNSTSARKLHEKELILDKNEIERKRKRRLEKDKINKKILKENSRKNAINRWNAILSLAVLSVFLICGLILVNNYDAKKRIDNENAKLNEQLKEIVKENESLRVDLAHSYDIGKIEERAKSELGMNAPTPSQVYYIDLPKANYVTYGKKNEPQKAGFRLALDKIGKVIN